MTLKMHYVWHTTEIYVILMWNSRETRNNNNTFGELLSHKRDIMLVMVTKKKKLLRHV